MLTYCAEESFQKDWQLLLTTNEPELYKGSLYASQFKGSQSAVLKLI